MARIKTADGRIVHTTSVETSNVSNPPQGSINQRTKHAHQETLEALVRARDHFISQTASLHRAERKSDKRAKKAHKKEWSRLEQQWKRKELSTKEYCKAIKNLQDARWLTEQAKEKRERLWEEVIEGREDIESEIKRREEILKNWRDDGVAVREWRILGDQDQTVCFDFCTPQCLLGLRKGGQLDLNCPNVVRHRRGMSGMHQISNVVFRELVSQQMSREQDDYRHLLFVGESLPGQPEKSRLGVFTLLLFGYTFLAKGYTYWWKRRASHEAEMYNRVDTFDRDGGKQEREVPLCFGLFDLPVPYRLPAVTDAKHWQQGENLGHILLFSYGAAPTSITTYPPLGFNETRANQLLKTMLMGQYGIGFSGGTTGFSALWENGRLVSIGLDEGSVIERSSPETILRKKRGPRKGALERYIRRRREFCMREEKRKKRKDAHLRWVAVDGDAVDVDGTPKRYVS